MRERETKGQWLKRMLAEDPERSVKDLQRMWMEFDPLGGTLHASSVYYTRNMVMGLPARKEGKKHISTERGEPKPKKEKPPEYLKPVRLEAASDPEMAKSIANNNHARLEPGIPLANLPRLVMSLEQVEDQLDECYGVAVHFGAERLAEAIKRARRLASTLIVSMEETE